MDEQESSVGRLLEELRDAIAELERAPLWDKAAVMRKVGAFTLGALARLDSRLAVLERRVTAAMGADGGVCPVSGCKRAAKIVGRYVSLECGDHGKFLAEGGFKCPS